MAKKLNSSEIDRQWNERCRLIRGDLNCWSRANGFEPALHHRMINGLLMRVSKREIKKLLLTLPTGSAKSTYSSCLFPPWYLAQHPKHGILACSHSASMAIKFGRTCRNEIDLHGEEIGFKLSDFSAAADEWETDLGGVYFAAGVTQRIAGRRFDLGLIDDPFGSREDADSQTYRDKVWDWYRSDFMSRGKPHACIVLITTRWHEDDLAGRLMRTEAHEWTIIHVPRVVETPTQEARDVLGRKMGDMLWPEYFTKEQDVDLRKDARAYQANQQGEPTPESGAFFTADMLRGYDSYSELPPETDMRFYCASDHAVRTKDKNDLTCLIPFGVDSTGTIWVLPDIWWKHGDTKEQVEAMMQMARRRQPIFWFAGRDHITGSIDPFLRTQMSDESNYFTIIELSDTNDKIKKAQAIHGMASVGKVRFPKFAEWWPRAQDELLKFDQGTHDDFVDALANMGRGLLSQSRGIQTQPAETDKVFNIHSITASWLKEQRDKVDRSIEVSSGW